MVVYCVCVCCLCCVCRVRVFVVFVVCVCVWLLRVVCVVCVCVCVCLCVAGVGLVCWWCGVDFGRIAEKLWKECWQYWCKRMFGIKVFLTLLISTLTSNISFIQLSSFNCLQCFRDIRRLVLRYLIKEGATMYQGKKREVSGLKESIK